MGNGDPRSALAFQGRSCKQQECGWRSPLISAALRTFLRTFVTFDEPLHGLHYLIEELEISEE
jgi:hypothetical protein